MNDKRYRYILYVITIVIVATIGIQVYWNFKNYQTNKQQLINDVQVSLDKAIDDYYANIAEASTMGLSFDKTSTIDIFENGSAFENILYNIDQKNGKLKPLDSIKTSEIKGLSVFRGFKADSMMEEQRKNNKVLTPDSFKLKMQELKEQNPNVRLGDFKLLTSKVMISITNDTLNLKVVDTLLKNELMRKNIDIDYNIKYQKNNTKSAVKEKVIVVETDSSIISNTSNKHLTVFSESTFLPKNGTVKIDFVNEKKVIFTRMLGGIGISTLLILSVIACLFYLLKIINQQKQLAEVKNDLISNITHEFKTPIATIGAALEGINNFNIIDDKEKTKQYINMSSGQLSRLNLMVEKLLETATLDSESLKLNKEPIDIILLLHTLCGKFQNQHTEKKFTTDFKIESLLINVDVFHFENALNNILDNAVKYGGDQININVSKPKKSININISDNGNSLNKTNKERIFEKFYRVPKGNQHDVKGFGIGLFYTKSIIEKHNGNITLDLSNKTTTFKIELPNG